jgi:23S rRNA (cytidine1920-2'-O)/16S rRNA (cytidine1409-2'-O)-methyltransferase
MSLKRIDQIICEHFPDLSRSQVQALIEEGRIRWRSPQGQWQKVNKPGQKISAESSSTDGFEIMPSDLVQYVSRGALKLKAALDFFDINVSGYLCLDVGLSTGGFSDLLLQNGAEAVLGVDVGTEQLHPRLKANPRLTFYDKVNARHPLPNHITDVFFAGKGRDSFDLIVVDVSFISLALVIGPLCPLLSNGGKMIFLVKPQFELDRQSLNKKGVVKDKSQNEMALQKIIEVCKTLNLVIIGHCPSPIEGENGNQEHLLLVGKDSDFIQPS